jgi:uncharacterized protein involved in high-affinity Fe2+ transport
MVMVLSIAAAAGAVLARGVRALQGRSSVPEAASSELSPARVAALSLVARDSPPQGADLPRTRDREDGSRRQRSFAWSQA